MANLKSSNNQFYKKRKHNTLPYLPAILILQAFLLVLFSECITFYDFYIPYTWVDFNNLYFIFFNTAIYFLILFLLFVMTKRMFPGYVFAVLLVTFFSVVGNMKWNELKEGISFSDLQKLSEALQVGGDAEFLGVFRLVISLILSVLIGIFIFLLDRMEFPKKKGQHKAWWRFYRILFVCLLLLFVVFTRWDWNRTAMERLREERTADVTGPAVYFLESVEKELYAREYSVKEAMHSYEHYVEVGKQVLDKKGRTNASQAEKDMEMPNVIVIMSEAFYDVNQLEGVLSYSSDPMAVYHEVAKEGICGSVAVNVYGGSTHYTEFEFLTGWNSRGMSLGGCPYKEYFKEFQPSLVKYFKDAGYSAIAIHPYEEWFWNRRGAYKNMGFDNFVGRDDMRYKKMCGYISDESLTQEIIYRYEYGERTTRPFFCFAVSIANHIALINDDKKENPPEQITVDFKGETGSYSENKKRRIARHVSGMEKSAEALRELTDYYKKVEEPTVIVFFGDHAPSYAAEILKAGSLDEDKAYETPFLIWSNYERKDVKNSALDAFVTNINGERMMNVSYFSTYLLDVLNLPIPRQGYYNIGLMSEYPVETRYMVKDRECRSFTGTGKREDMDYMERLIDTQDSINTLLEHPKQIENVWDVSR